jgi:hypothetical protein
VGKDCGPAFAGKPHEVDGDVDFEFAQQAAISESLLPRNVDEMLESHLKRRRMGVD